jgi:hypothetical protein
MPDRLDPEMVDKLAKARNALRLAILVKTLAKTEVTLTADEAQVLLDEFTRLGIALNGWLNVFGHLSHDPDVAGNLVNFEMGKVVDAQTIAEAAVRVMMELRDKVDEQNIEIASLKKECATATDDAWASAHCGHCTLDPDGNI